MSRDGTLPHRRPGAHEIETASHALTSCSESGPLFDDLARDIPMASHRVWLETYIYRDDALGGPFAELLVAAAQRDQDIASVTG